MSFSTGNPAVETIHGWLFVRELPSSSHPPALIAAAQESSGEQLTAPSSQLPSEPDSTLSVPTSAALTRDSDEKWLTVSRKARTVPSSPSSQSAFAVAARSPSLSAYSGTRASPSLTSSSALTASLPTPLSLSSTQSSLAPPPTSSAASPSRLLCVWDVPAHVTVPEVHTFISDDVDDDDNAQQLEHAQLVMRERSAEERSLEAVEQQRSEGEEEESAYCVLLDFRSVSAATSFLQRYNLRRYNEIEKDVCCVSYLHHVGFDDPRHRFPASLSTLPAPPATSTATAAVDDLPLCPVCLEPLQPPTGPSSPLLTTLCLHHFHFSCLSQWADSTCPVCRFSLHPALLSSCSSCHHPAASSLWMCLLCGHVGCSRYIGGHAYRHWEESGHGYCLSVSTQRVWDYVREEYVHRLVRSKRDGKLVELSGGRRKQRTKRRHTAQREGEGWEEEAAEESFSSLEDAELGMSLKLEDMLIEYNYLLSSQLDKQRQYYQQQLHSLDREMATRQHAQQSALQQLSAQQLALTERLSALQAELAESEEELRVEESEHTRLRNEWDKLRRMNDKLSAKQAEVRAAVEKEQGRKEAEEEQLMRSKDGEIAELEEQLRDLHFFAQTQRQVSRSGMKDDIQGGKLYVAAGEGGGQEDEKKAVRSGGKKKKKR